jgi:Uncharacterized conserved protein
MKRVFTICLALVMVLSLTACSGANKNQTNSSAASSDSESSSGTKPNATMSTSQASANSSNTVTSSTVSSVKGKESSSSSSRTSTKPISSTVQNKTSVSSSLPKTSATETQPEKSKGATEMKIKITAGSNVLTATLYDNATVRALVSKLPLTVPMENLYSREMCYRFPDALPTDNVQATGYEVGELVYWPPRHSLVILYAQNGEHFDMQKLGRFDSSVDLFKQIDTTNVTFELDQ